MSLTATMLSQSCLSKALPLLRLATGRYAQGKKIFAESMAPVMKKIFLFCTFLLLSTFCFSQNDSIKGKRKINFVIDLIISPSICFEDQHSLTGSRDNGYRYKSPLYSFSIYNDYGIWVKSSLITIGFGISQYSYNKYDEYSFNNNGTEVNSKNTFQFNYFFYKFPVKYYLFIGKKQDWFAGISSEISILHSYETSLHETRTISYNNGTIDVINNSNSTSQKVPQTIIWVGLEFGKVLKLSKWFQIDFSIDMKYSSRINGQNKGPYSDYAANYSFTSRNLFVISFNIVSMFKI